ncbi:MAG: M20/M25/M40 family metallo-hydrolase [Holophagaceae bacterium]|nr:M20/M25/M40 family metallo-hydrolase [Holophagaceae bacterium]
MKTMNLTKLTAIVPACLIILALRPYLSAQHAIDLHVQDRVAQVEPARLKAIVQSLVDFGTRHSLSDPTNPTRGNRAAQRWIIDHIKSLQALPGSRLQLYEERFMAGGSGRLPDPVELANLGAILPGTDPARSKDVLVIAGHYDSLPSGRDVNADGPGAVDDASGVSISLEMARIMAAEKPAITIYFVASAAEEQGLVGATHLAKRLKSEGYTVRGMVAVDILGNIKGINNDTDNTTIRCFSEGVPSAETDAQKRIREALGGENDGLSREFARYVKRFGEPYSDNLDIWLMLRRDRVGRGGDHTPFANEGFPGIRFTDTFEHYDRQHQIPRIENGRKYGDTMEFFDENYVAKVARALLASFMHLSHAPAPPFEVGIGGNGTANTILRWKLPDDDRISGLILYRRRSDSIHWQRTRMLPKSTEVILQDVMLDNYVFAIATVDAKGNESVPVYPTALLR